MSLSATKIRRGKHQNEKSIVDYYDNKILTENRQQSLLMYHKTFHKSKKGIDAL